MQETRIWSLGGEDPLEKGMATYSNTLAWKIPWTEEPWWATVMGLQRVRHELVTKHQQPYSVYLFQSTNTFLNDREHLITIMSIEVRKKFLRNKYLTGAIFLCPTSARSGKRKAGGQKRREWGKKEEGISALSTSPPFCFCCADLAS